MQEAGSENSISVWDSGWDFPRPDSSFNERMQDHSVIEHSGTQDLGLALDLGVLYSSQGWQEGDSHTGTHVHPQPHEHIRPPSTHTGPRAAVW